MKDSRQLLTLRQAESITGRRVATWRKDIRLRKVGYVKLGRQVRIPVEVINELMRTGYRPAIPSAEAGR